MIEPADRTGNAVLVDDGSELGGTRAVEDDAVGAEVELAPDPGDALLG